MRTPPTEANFLFLIVGEIAEEKIGQFCEISGCDCFAAMTVRERGNYFNLSNIRNI